LSLFGGQKVTPHTAGRQKALSLGLFFPLEAFINHLKFCTAEFWTALPT
jgi:hypothetical protein